jgi:hypothetical protein
LARRGEDTIAVFAARERPVPAKEEKGSLKPLRSRDLDLSKSRKDHMLARKENGKAELS